MGLYGSFYSSLSGLSTSSSALSVIGNNLANLNTVGFKGSSAQFQDLFNAAIANQGSSGNGNPMQVGLGASLSSTSQDFSQGSFQSTGQATDMALQGNGFFTLQTAQGSQVYTRDGNFSVNNSGYLVDSQGNRVMGWNATAGVVNPGGLPTPIYINMAATSGGVATKNFQVDANLNSASTSAFNSTVQVYDSLGASHSITLTFSPSATSGVWNVSAPTASDGGAVGAGTTPLPATINFDSTGALTGWTDTTGTLHSLSAAGYVNPSFSVTNWPGAATQPVTWQLATTSLTAAPTPNITSYASASATSGTSQDGYGAGTVSAITVDQNGVIQGSYTNGQTIPMAQVAISTFLNQNGLSKQGGNNWVSTAASGTPAVATANSGGRGTVLGSNLELSNVDVASQLTQMIINQNAYQANSRIITTDNTLLQSILNLVQ